MSDNTERPATSGGDVIADEALLNDDGTTSAKVQTLKLMLGDHGKDAGRASDALPVPGQSEASLWRSIRDELAIRRRLLASRLPDTRVGPGCMLPTRPGGPVPAPPSTTLLQALGSRLKLEFKANYNSGTATWTDGVVAQTVAQSIAGSRPASTTTTNGNFALHFDGVDDNLRNDTGFGTPLGGLPGRGSGGNSQRMICCIFRTSVTTGVPVFWKINGGSTGIGFGVTAGSNMQLIWFDASDGSSSWARTGTVNDGNWHTMIVIGDDTTSHVDMYIDGSNAGCTQGTAVNNLYMGYDWGSSTEVVGSDDSNFYTGDFGELAFAYTATTFSAGDIAAVNAALRSYISG